MTERTDTELVHDAIVGDRVAWEALVDRYSRLVWHVVHGYRQLDHDRRADVYQTVWLRLAEHLDRVRDPARVGGWLATTARNEAMRQLRLAGREQPTDEPDAAPVEHRLDRALLDDERDAVLWDAFAKLKPQHQQLLRLLIADPPLSYDEIATVLDIPRGSIGPTRQRCLEALRRMPGIANLEGTS